jgi:Tfp pilus assembly protein PilW
MDHAVANDEIRMTNDETMHSSFVIRHSSFDSPAGHTLIELVAAMVCAAILLAGLGSVMLIARQVAYTPSAAGRRAEAADVISIITDELQHATLIIGQSPNVLEFVVADRNADGTAEKFRYAWSGTNGDPLLKSVNGGTPITVLERVANFNATYLLRSKTTTLATTTESAEITLLTNTTTSGATDREIRPTRQVAQLFTVPKPSSGPNSSAVGWQATRVSFYGSKSSSDSETLLVQLRAAGSFSSGPTSHVLGEVQVAESSLSGGLGWNSAVFANPVRRLSLDREYAVSWSQVQSSGEAARLGVNFNLPAPIALHESTDGGASWHYWQEGQYAQIFGELFGRYILPGPSYNVTRDYVTHIRLVLQSGGQSHARIDAGVPLMNEPELLSSYWRTDFDRDPTTANGNGDAVADWAMASGTFDTGTLSGGVWDASGALETRPPNDFTKVTTVDVRCRNATVGGNGAVIRINAGRYNALSYGPILVYLQRQDVTATHKTQTLTLSGKTSDAATSQLFRQTRLPSNFVHVRLTILPQYKLVNLAINGEDQGTFSYPTYAPSSSNDRFLTLYADTSAAEFDHVEVRVANN